MTRDLIAGTLAAALIVGAAAVILWALPVNAAQCAGQIVTASHYGAESGNRTANGERFTGRDLTAAHRSLPFGTRLKVSYLGKSVVVRINDRGPYIRGRALDLSTAAAHRIGIIRAGVAKVCVERLN